MSYLCLGRWGEEEEGVEVEGREWKLRGGRPEKRDRKILFLLPRRNKLFPEN